MAKEIKLRRGTETDHIGFTGSQAEVTVNTTDWSLRVHDGVTSGGHSISGGSIEAGAVITAADDSALVGLTINQQDQFKNALVLQSDPGEYLTLTFMNGDEDAYSISKSDLNALTFTRHFIENELWKSDIPFSLDSSGYVHVYKAPVGPEHAANKAYVDSAVGGGGVISGTVITTADGDGTVGLTIDQQDQNENALVLNSAVDQYVSLEYSTDNVTAWTITKDNNDNLLFGRYASGVHQDNSLVVDSLGYVRAKTGIILDNDTTDTPEITYDYGDGVTPRSISMDANLASGFRILGTNDNILMTLDQAGNANFTGSVNGAGGSATFVGLSDTPVALEASKYLQVNALGTALELVDTPVASIASGSIITTADGAGTDGLTVFQQDETASAMVLKSDPGEYVSLEYRNGVDKAWTITKNNNNSLLFGRAVAGVHTDNPLTIDSNGNVEILNTPSIAVHATNKGYVDGAITTATTGLATEAYVDSSVVSTFTELSDTPASLVPNKYLQVNAGGSAIELVDTPAATITTGTVITSPNGSGSVGLTIDQQDETVNALVLRSEASQHLSLEYRDNVTKKWTITKDNGNNLLFANFNSGSQSNDLSITAAGYVEVDKAPVGIKGVATKAYVDGEIAAIPGGVTYTGASGVTVDGSVISHTDSSSQLSVNNSDATVIQDLYLDTNGHVTSIGSATLSYATVGAAASSHTHTGVYSEASHSHTSFNESAFNISTSGDTTIASSSGSIHLDHRWGIFGDATSNTFCFDAAVDVTTSYGFQTNARIKSVAYDGFTGSHIVFTGNTELVPGDIICVEDVYPVNIHESYAVIDTTTTAQNKRVYGILSEYDPDINVGIESTMYYETKDSTRSVIPEYSDTVNEILARYSSMGYTASVGEGGINVCEEGGDIESGDYICSSNTAGKGMKQNDDLLHNYTVAKSLSNVNWSAETAGVDGCYLVDGVKCKTIACTYHCG